MNISRTTTIALLAAFVVRTARRGVEPVRPLDHAQARVEATAAEVTMRIATPDYTLLPALAAQATDTTGNARRSRSTSSTT